MPRKAFLGKGVEARVWVWPCSFLRLNVLCVLFIPGTRLPIAPSINSLSDMVALPLFNHCPCPKHTRPHMPHATLTRALRTLCCCVQALTQRTSTRLAPLLSNQHQHQHQPQQHHPQQYPQLQPPAETQALLGPPAAAAAAAPPIGGAIADPQVGEPGVWARTGMANGLRTGVTYGSRTGVAYGLRTGVA